jgi:hypothetical protein
MAQRTGIAELDALLVSFERNEHVYLSGADIDQPVSAWRDCDSSNAACHAISETFVEHLIGSEDDFDEDEQSDNGIRACLSDEAGGDEFADSADALGYQDRPVRGAPWHTVAIVYAAEQVFAVDWSAHQFGYTEFPLVQRYDPAAKAWQRQWN